MKRSYKEIQMYDAIVVGARCAGSPTAMLLARKGHRVLLVDRAGFPSDALSTHYIHQSGVAYLHRWGLLPRIAEAGAPAIRNYRLDVGPFALTGAPPPIGEIAEAYSLRRTILDQILVEAAAEAGVEVRERYAVEALTTDGDKVTGIRSRGGHAEQARIVIGADGLHSVVAKGVDAPVYNDQGTLTCAYYAYWRGVPMDGVELYLRPGCVIVAAPTNDDQVVIVVLRPSARFHEIRKDVEGHFVAALELAPDLAARVSRATRADRFRGTGRLPNFYRRSHGDGWALVGDAGYHKDPILALGISDAFRDAQLLADTIDAGLPLENYEKARNEQSADGFQRTVEFARLEPPPPLMQQLFGALRDRPLDRDRLFGALAGTFPGDEFFAPDNLARMLAPVQAAA
jgi:flavin-dependent dehydrogenase